MTFFPPVSQDKVVQAVFRLQLGHDGQEGLQDLEEALAVACQTYVVDIDGMDANYERPEGWEHPTEPEDSTYERGSRPVGFSLDDGGTGHILSLVHWALWKGGVEEPIKGQLMHELWSGLRPQTVAAANNDLKAHRDHRLPDEQRAAEERLLAQLRASHRQIRELTDIKLVGRD